MTIQDLIGKYSISGTNQDENTAITYNGILTLSLDQKIGRAHV